jgi:hypothetical protein
MSRFLKIISCLVIFILMNPAISMGGQFKITRVYDGTTVRAEGYDPKCLA